MRDRRRFKVARPPTGKLRRLAADHPAIVEETSSMARSVKTAAEAGRVLVDGCNNRKIGGDVLVGSLAGAKIFTVTLETRRTCPRHCPLWDACYDQGIHGSSLRLRPDASLIPMLLRDVRAACARHELVLIRLHVLGDFYSAEYIAAWHTLLGEWPNLYVFGFTAHHPEEPLGQLLQAMRAQWDDRWMVRFSGRESLVLEGDMDARKFDRGGVVCPQQRHALTDPERGTHCGNCAVCWETSKRIIFWGH